MARSLKKGFFVDPGLMSRVQIAQSADDGIPYIINHNDSEITEEYNKIAAQIYETVGTSMLNKY